MALDHERTPLKGVPVQFEAQIRRLVHLSSFNTAAYIAEKSGLNQEVLGYLEIGINEKNERIRARADSAPRVYRD